MTDSTAVVLGVASLPLVVILYVWFALALAAMFGKMGEAAWKAWVPVLNVATVLQRGDFSPWLVLLNLVPLFGAVAFLIVFIVAVHRITTAFGGGVGLTVVGALFPVVWASVLGWGSARWSGLDGAGDLEERSGPFRTGSEHTPPYVPLIGGWTPDAVGAGDGPGSARSRWTSGATDAPADGRGGAEPAPVSELVVIPFAAPALSLADAIPSSSDWSPPADPAPVSFQERRRGDDAPPRRTDMATDASESGAEGPFRATDPAPAPAVSVGVSPSMPSMVCRVPAPPDVPRAGGAPAVPPLPSPAEAGRSAASPPPRQLDRAEDAEKGPDAFDAAGSPPSRRAQRSGAGILPPVADVPLDRSSSPTEAIARPTAVAPEEEFPELSEAVSAVSEAPDAGSPRSARTSVSSLFTQPAVPEVFAHDEVDALDRTVVTRRKRIPWMLVPPSGAPVALTSEVVVLGRRPAPDAEHPDAQLVAISDETRTVSKTHARLHLRGERWFVTDLDSTNGVLFATLMGTEVEAPPGEEIEAGARFFLGDAEVRLARSDA